MQFEFMLNDSHHAICGDSGVYLDSDSSLCRTPKGFDFKMLLNPLKEEFYAPTIFIEKSDLRGWYLHVVGQVDICFGIAKVVNSNRHHHFFALKLYV